jgi:hypothetical protein
MSINEPQHRHNVESTGISESFQSATENSVLRSESAKKPASNGQCVGVAVQKGGSSPYEQVCEHCGAPATADAPVQLCAVDGEEFLLHPACRADWLDDNQEEKAK